jgi:hypothetical protein
MCRIAEIPMKPEAWNIAYGDSNVAWESGARQGVMRVNLAGTTGSVSGLPYKGYVLVSKQCLAAELSCTCHVHSVHAVTHSVRVNLAGTTGSVSGVRRL